MASDKNANRNAEAPMGPDAASDTGAVNIVAVDDIPDRLLILASRLQKAIDTRQTVAKRDPSEMARPAKQGEDER
ncbi:MAG TPA: hypothetical protein VGO04_32400 [Ensifer sp.]|jgi:hypothetical protein|uniref:hypothetical protein n=1 Tax=Ensifer sp. TaxID=1872086 RepID=UPI002E11AF3A|nr:hypothetical protein [Ensifer sp.]